MMTEDLKSMMKIHEAGNNLEMMSQSTLFQTFDEV